MNAPHPPSRLGPPPGVLALLAAFLLALALCHPILGDPGGLALGHPLVDTYNHVWGYWQVGAALTALETPLHTDLMHWPGGGALWFIDLLGAILTLPVQWLWGPVVAYNVALIGNLTLAGLGAWALAREVCRSDQAAAIALVSYEAMPHVLGQLHNGISETVATGWLPLVFLGALRLRAVPTRARAAVAGLALGLCGLANWYYGLFAALGLLPFVFETLLPGRRQRALRQLLPVAMASAGALLIPALLLFRGTLEATDALVLRDPDFVGRTLVGHNMVDLLSFVTPGDHHSPDLKVLFDEDMIVVVYPGLSLVALALLGLRLDRRARPWAAAAAATFVLSLGAYLYIAGDYLTLPGGDWLPLPYLLLFENLPLFSPISHAFRFVVPMQMCLGVMAALGLAAAGRRLGPRVLTVGAALACAVFLVEALRLSPARVPLPTSPTTVPRAYAELPGDGAVIDLPISIQVLSRSRYNLYQIQHGRPLPYGLNDPTPRYLDQNPLTRAVLYLERTSVDSVGPVQPHLVLAEARADLVEAGFSAVVVHRGLYPPALQERVLGFLSIALGEGQDTDDRVVFAL